jgi:hypothetical protein
MFQSFKVKSDLTGQVRFWFSGPLSFLLGMALVFLAACGGGSPSSQTEPPPSPQPQPLPSSQTVTLSWQSLILLQGSTFGIQANIPVNWSIQEGSIGGTIVPAANDEKFGIYTAPQHDGVFHIVATSMADITKTAVATVTIPSVSVVVEPRASAIQLGQSFRFSAEVYGTVYTTVNWTLIEDSAGGFISSDGQFTAPSSPGVFHIVGTSVADPSKSGAATITVVTAPPTLTRGTNMVTSRAFHTATLLPTGKLAGKALIAGGIPGWDEVCGCARPPVASAELFDPVTVVSSSTGDMSQGRSAHSAILMSDGRVLMTDGRTADVFDPDTGAFTTLGNVDLHRFNATLTPLKDGRVLIAGGADESGPLLTAELYDPLNGTLTPTGKMTAPRFVATSVLLADGKVLVLGGEDDSGTFLTTAEIYDPATGTFSAVGHMTTPRVAGTATVLNPSLLSSKVLIAGGSDRTSSLAIAELFDPVTETFSRTGDMLFARAIFTSTLLPNSKVFITGDSTSMAEVYDPETGSFSAIGTMNEARWGNTATLLPDGTVLITGGLEYDASSDTTVAVSSTENYVPQ